MTSQSHRGLLTGSACCGLEARALTQRAQHHDLHLQLADPLAVAGVCLQLLQILADMRGNLQRGIRPQRARLCMASGKILSVVCRRCLQAPHPCFAECSAMHSWTDGRGFTELTVPGNMAG